MHHLESRGHVRVRSADPLAPPSIQPNYLATRVDREAAVAGLRWGRRLLGSDALAPWRAGETVPGPHCADDAALLAHARARGSTVYHAVGTCRMGTDPAA